MKKILSILFAIVISISAISIGILPASAKIVDRQFVVDEVVYDYDQYLSTVNSDLVIDVSGYFEIVSRTYLTIGVLEIGVDYDVYDAPLGYYIIVQTDRNDNTLYLVDRVAFRRNSSNTVAYLYLDGDLVTTAYVQDIGYVILPVLPEITDSPVGDMFVKSKDYLTVVKFGDGNPTPAYPIPDQSLPRIFEVWQSVTGWIADGLSSVAGVFYTAGQLTLIGTLAVISVGIALIFLLIAFIRKFLFLRG